MQVGVAPAPCEAPVSGASQETGASVSEEYGELFDTDVFVDHLRGAHRLAVPYGRTAYSVVTRC